MADTKNYGLKGVGDDVQFGKAGGRFVFNTGAADFRATTDGSTLSHLQVLTPVGDTDAATKLYVDDVASGLDVKQSCNFATTANHTGYTATTGPLSNGQFTTFSPTTVDGQALTAGDRVLIKDQTNADENGIYVVQSTTTTLNRADDADTSGEFNAGAFTFIEAGPTNADSGWVLQGPDPLTIGTGGGSNLNFVLFSTSSDIVAGTGLLKTGNVLDLDFSQLTSASVIATADELIFQDGTVESRITVANFLADRDIVTTTSGAVGFLVQTANDTYTVATIAASAVAGEQGIIVNSGDGSPATTIGVNIAGTTLLTDAVATGDSLLMYNSAVDAGQAIGNYEVTVDSLKTFMNAGTSATSITEGDSILAVSDSGTDGTLTWTADNVVVLTIDDTVATFSNGLDITMATGSTITVADLTQFDVLVAGASGLVSDSGGNLTFNAGVLTVTGSAQVDNVNINGNTISSTAGVDLLLTPLAGQQLILDTAIIVDNGSMTGITTLGFDTVSLTNIDISTEFTDNDVSIMTSAAVDDRILSYSYSTTAGTVTSSGSPLVNQVAVFTTATDIDSTSTFTWDATTLVVNELSFAGDTISNNTLNQPIIIRPNGTGSIIFQNGSSEETLELLDVTGAINGLSITPGITGGNKPIIAIGTGGEANVDIGFATNGTGVLSVAAGTYEANVTDDDDIPNKKYVDDAITNGAVSGALDSVTGVVDIATVGAQNIGATTIPINAHIISVMMEVTDISDTTSTVTVGDATNGADSYMTIAENDPQVLGTYVADTFVDNTGGAVQAIATVASDSTASASATIIITFRHA